jgi:hypothetical protein
MEYRDLYLGHTINAWTSEAGAGLWTWAYTIDDETRVEGSGPPQPSERAMLDEAIAQARSAVDRYPKAPPDDA